MTANVGKGKYAGNLSVIRGGAIRSARAILPMMLELIPPPETAVDVGGGEGWWGAYLAEHCGTEVVCLDGEIVEGTPIPVIETDLEQPGSVGGPYDLGICVEVAEHLTPERGPSFIAELCQAAPAWVFSAAIPGQTGIVHVNCRWQSYWADEFKRNGFKVTQAAWRVWRNTFVEAWYRQNLLFAWEPEIHEISLPEVVMDVVHPDIWRWQKKKLRIWDFLDG